MKYQKKLIEDVVVISIDKEELFSADSNEILSMIKSEIEKGKFSFIIDLHSVKYLNSTGINFLIAVLTFIRNNGGELVLASISEKIKSLLIITKLNSIFNVKSSVGESIEFFSAYNKVELK